MRSCDARREMVPAADFICRQQGLKRVPLVSGFFITPELGIAGDKDEGAVGMRLDAARQIAAAPVTQRRCVAR
jgi:hypothetical protein